MYVYVWMNVILNECYRIGEGGECDCILKNWYYLIIYCKIVRFRYFLNKIKIIFILNIVNFYVFIKKNEYV